MPVRIFLFSRDIIQRIFDFFDVRSIFISLMNTKVVLSLVKILLGEKKNNKKFYTKNVKFSVSFRL